jgi:hypothetical protein
MIFAIKIAVDAIIGAETLGWLSLVEEVIK